jgi:hypothetical protein
MGDAMPLVSDIKDIAQTFQSLMTGLGVIAAGAWAYHRYILEENRYPHIETSAEIAPIGKKDGYWIVELQAILVNKGKVQHKIEKFGFDLNALYASDTVNTSKKWGNQVDFPHEVAKGSFIPKTFEYFVIGPGVTSKYSYVARVPREATFLILHCWFEYSDGRGYSHTMEKTINVPQDFASLEAGDVEHI